MITFTKINTSDSNYPLLKTCCTFRFRKQNGGTTKNNARIQIQTPSSPAT